ncbi:MAG: nucleoside phosphorylase [Verrucomicrobia bacterium]|nr:nucleoside phosphorylase [Verrucomicrobiota bacterium]
MLPQYSEKYAHASMITPEKNLDHRRQHGRFPKSAPPRTVILCYSSRFMKQVLQNYAHQQCEECFSKLYYLTDYPSVAIGNFGVGAPVTALRMEDLISWGVKQFIAIGSAGAISPKLTIGDIVLCEKAVRDEGTSFHYMPPSKYIHAPQRMRLMLGKHLNKMQIAHRVGSTWTTDSFYRQTSLEVKHFQDEGILTVEMEAAAIFAVAHVHQVDLGAMFTISDLHTDQDWMPHFENEKKWEGMHNILKAALAAAAEE